MACLRHFFLVAVLVFAQLAAGLHAVEHAAGKEGALPLHPCQLCLSAHDLGAGLTGEAPLPPVVEVVLTPEEVSFTARSNLPAPRTSQRAPPLA